jgi:2-isopropylmalate synthase
MRNDAPFEVTSYKVTTERATGRAPRVQAIVEVRMGGARVRRAGTGKGPVHALDAALRACLEEQFPQLNDVRLTDYKVSMVGSGASTGSKVRVMIEATDGDASWDAGCTSENIIDASFEALCSTWVMGILRHHSASLRSA